MTDVPPCASKQGPKARTTGAEPAGGSARGAGVCWPQNGIDGSAAAAACPAGVWAPAGVAANASPAAARKFTCRDIYWILAGPRRWRVGDVRRPPRWKTPKSANALVSYGLLDHGAGGVGEPPLRKFSPRLERREARSIGQGAGVQV